MSQTFLFYLTVAVTLGVAAQSSAASDSSLVWDDTLGFVTVDRCISLDSPSPIPVNLGKYLDSVVQLTDVVPLATMAPFDVVDSYWQAATPREAFIRCSTERGEIDYVVFKVYRRETQEPVARVGINAENTAIFKYSRLLSVPEAEDSIEGRSSAPAVTSGSLVQGVSASVGPLEYVVCTKGTELNVRDQTLENILFKAKRFETLKPVQSFGVDRIEKVINGTKYFFAKVQLPSRPVNDDIGWIADQYLKLRSECPGATNTGDSGEPTAPTCVFPLNKRTSANYKTGMRRFSAGRSGGRLHAAADLYRIEGEATVAANTVTVIRDRYYFYQGTYALEVREKGGRVLRYGEITGRAAPGVSVNRTVQSGQTIGYIGKVNSNCCTPMLHFEMYSGKASGALTQKGTKYQRRRDLMDPSGYLTDWEKAKFGRSY